MAEKIKELQEICRKIRINILKMLYLAGSGHTGSSLSCVEILVSLYFHKMRHNPKDPKWPQRDIFVLSKGHAAPALYAVLTQAGYFPEEELSSLRKLGSRLQGHTSSIHLPGIEFSAGMLGQGLSFANGQALRAKINKNPRYHYILLSDGEMEYGQTWQAAMTASHYELDNVCAVIDFNDWQIDGRVSEIKGITPLSLENRWRAFGWRVQLAKGHDLKDLIEVLDTATKESKIHKKPGCIIAQTTKGKGVSFMEDDNEFHGRAPTKEELEKALEELEGESCKD